MSDSSCLGLLEFNSIASGIVATDALLKQAAVRVLVAKTVCPGKYIVLFTGEVEEVRSSLVRGKEAGGGAVIDELFLPNAHPTLIPAVEAVTEVKTVEALGVIETFSVASALVAADIAVKKAEVFLIEVRLAMGIGGKSFVTLTGEVADVRDAVNAGSALVKERGLLVRDVVIPQAHPDLARWLM